MSLRLKLPLHGRSHLENGSDPIPGIGDFIRYDFENVGDWLYIKATGQGGPLNRNMGFEFTGLAGGVEWHSTDGSVDFDLIFDNYSFNLQCQSIDLTTVDPNSSSTGPFTITLGRGMAINLPFGGSYDFVVNDGASPRLVISQDGTGDIHIPTGGNIIADL